jgi:hypothetical protein
VKRTFSTKGRIAELFGPARLASGTRSRVRLRLALARPGPHNDRVTRTLTTLTLAQCAAALGALSTVLILMAADMPAARKVPSVSGVERIKTMLAVRAESLARR